MSHITRRFRLSGDTGGLDKESLYEQSRTARITASAGATGISALNAPESTSTLIVGKPAGLRFTSFLKFAINIPPGSNIERAILRLSNSGAVGGGTIDFACLEPDGKWDQPFQSLKTIKRKLEAGEHKGILNRTISPDTKLEGNSSNGFNLADLSLGGNVLGKTGQTSTTDNLAISLNCSYSDVFEVGAGRTYSAAQGVKIDTAGLGVIARVECRLRQPGTDPPGTGIQARLWKANPTTFNILELTATSDVLPYSSIASSFLPQSIIFTPNIPTQVGDAWVVEIFDNSPTTIGIANAIQIAGVLSTTGLDDDENIYITAPKSGFSKGNYPLTNDLPFVYSGLSGTTINRDPHGSIIKVSYPAGATLQTTTFDITKIVQEWIHSRQYRNLHQGVIGIVMESGDNFGNQQDQFVAENAILRPSIDITYSPSSVIIT